MNSYESKEELKNRKELMNQYEITVMDGGKLHTN